MYFLLSTIKYLFIMVFILYNYIFIDLIIFILLIFLLTTLISQHVRNVLMSINKNSKIVILWIDQ